MALLTVVQGFKLPPGALDKMNAANMDDTVSRLTKVRSMEQGPMAVTYCLKISLLCFVQHTIMRLEAAIKQSDSSSHQGDIMAGKHSKE